MHRKRRHVRAKRDLRGRRVQEFGEDFACVRECGVSLSARRISPVGVRVVMVEVVRHLFDDVARNLRSAGSIEISDWVVVVDAFESGEVTSDFLNWGDLWLKGCS